ncbi:intraflagellar transport protein 80 homolog, partial [Diaphorina citri]|uniref:Intraflagellar transport protein 80 homolog n=1 Tax=Diaphorina citri TaxID=121845 RepID=A0A1S3DRN9_DIACI
MILQAEKYFLLVEKSSVSVYSYDGRLITSPRWPNMLCDHITRSTISISSDVVLIRDQIDEK